MDFKQKLRESISVHDQQVHVKFCKGHGAWVTHSELTKLSGHQACPLSTLANWLPSGGREKRTLRIVEVAIVAMRKVDRKGRMDRGMF